MTTFSSVQSSNLFRDYYTRSYQVKCGPCLFQRLFSANLVKHVWKRGFLHRDRPDGEIHRIKIWRVWRLNILHQHVWKIAPTPSQSPLGTMGSSPILSGGPVEVCCIFLCSRYHYILQDLHPVDLGIDLKFFLSKNKLGVGPWRFLEMLLGVVSADCANWEWFDGKYLLVCENNPVELLTA